MLDAVYDFEKIRKKRSTDIVNHLEVFDNRSETYYHLSCILCIPEGELRIREKNMGESSSDIYLYVYIYRYR